MPNVMRVTLQLSSAELSTLCDALGLVKHTTVSDYHRLIAEDLQCRLRVKWLALNEINRQMEPADQRGTSETTPVSK